MNFSDINFLAVFVAALAAFILGSIWYSVLFGKAWQKELGMSDEELEGANMAMIFGSSFLMMLIMAFGMGMLLQGHSCQDTELTMTIGLYHGLMIGVLFVGTSQAINYLYQRKSIKLWLIDASYQILFLGIMGAILGAWH